MPKYFLEIQSSGTEILQTIPWKKLKQDIYLNMFKITFLGILFHSGDRVLPWGPLFFFNDVRIWKKENKLNRDW